MGDAASRWREELASWAIPPEVRSTVTESPWVMPAEVFARRSDYAIAHPAGRSFDQALEALAPRGSVLDVGCGAGAASLPLADHASELVAVDPDPAMLEELTVRARRLNLMTQVIQGHWPDVAGQTPAADVVTCHHVCYNVADLGEFALALSSHARRRVVVELTSTHPSTSLNPLWHRLHGIDRPAGPTAADAVAVLREAGIAPQELAWIRGPRPGYASFDDMVAFTRQRLCLDQSRTGELIDALRELGVTPEQPRELGAQRPVVTLWWDV